MVVAKRLSEFAGFPAFWIMVMRKQTEHRWKWNGRLGAWRQQGGQACTSKGLQATCWL